MDDSRRVLLRTHLQAVVPLRMAELSASTDAELLVAMEHIWTHDPDGRREPWVGAADAPHVRAARAARHRIAAPPRHRPGTHGTPRRHPDGACDR